MAPGSSHDPCSLDLGGRICRALVSLIPPFHVLGLLKVLATVCPCEPYILWGGLPLWGEGILNNSDHGASVLTTVLWVEMP